MNIARGIITITITISFLTGCASIDFDSNDGGLPFYDPVPYLFVSTTKECVTTATMVILPGHRRLLKFKRGYGSYDLSISLENGMIKSVGQKADTKIPETISAIGQLAAAVPKIAKDVKTLICDPEAKLYLIEEGRPAPAPIDLPVPQPHEFIN